MIINDQNYKYGSYCGERTGHTVLVNGSYVAIRFYTDRYVQRKGFLLFFTAVQIGKYRIAKLEPSQWRGNMRKKDQTPNSSRLFLEQSCYFNWTPSTKKPFPKPCHLVALVKISKKHS